MSPAKAPDSVFKWALWLWGNNYPFQQSLDARPPDDVLRELLGFYQAEWRDQGRTDTDLIGAVNFETGWELPDDFMGSEANT